MSAYYNEIDPYAAQWLRNLIAAGHIAAGVVDERSIEEVTPDDVRGFVQCHFFAGIGGWSFALRLAGWGDSRPVWTGSCPCQKHSSATHGRKVARDWWPEWALLIAANRPDIVFGEQVDEAVEWLDAVCVDMEAVGYEISAAILPACSVGADHVRERIYFAGYSDCHGQSVRSVYAEASGLQRFSGEFRDLAGKDGLPKRMGAMRAYGNAIVPQVAAEFIGAYMDCRP